MTRGLPVVATLLAACIPVTVNMHLHFDELRDEVENRERDLNERSRETESNEQGMAPVPDDTVLYYMAAQDQPVDLTINTPRMRELAERRMVRQRRVIAYLDRGVIGEANNGTWTLLNREGLSRDELRTLEDEIREENRDREAEWEEIRRANDQDNAAIDRVIRPAWVEGRHNSILRTESIPGTWMLQNEDGNWETKQARNEREQREGGNG